MPRGRGRRGRLDGGGGSKHPPHLKGKDIGLFYAARSKKKREEQNFHNRSEVTLSSLDSQRINSLLDRANAAVPPPQPDRYRPFEDEGENASASIASSSTSQMEGADKIKDVRVFANDVDGCEEGLSEAFADQLNDFSNAPEALPALRPNKSADEAAIRQLARTRASSGYQRLLTFRQQLPAFAFKEEVVSLLDEHRVIVVSGETGCGKTTQVPQFLLEAEIEGGRGSSCRIVVTQPRRISAISVAHRVAEERGEPLGRCVGFQIRLESVLPQSLHDGCILFCTTGIVLQRMQGDSRLANVSHLIIDEIHERDLQTDLLLVLLKDLLLERSDLRVVLMSATLNAHRFAEYFQLPQAALLHIPGRTFPVTSIGLEETLAQMQYHCDPVLLEEMSRKNRRMFGRGTRKREEFELQEQYEVFLRNNFEWTHTRDFLTAMGWKERVPNRFVADVVEHVLRTTTDGAILVFLPGWSDIKETIGILTKEKLPRLGHLKVRLHPLHSMLPTSNQREVFERPPSGVRKVIVATNIAETSITIDDVVYVVDCGQIKVTQYDPATHTNVMQPVLESRANATQRAGRAGRVQPGRCFRLVSSFQADYLMLKELPPEMLRTRLEETILQIKMLKCGSAEAFLSKAIDPPSERGIRRALTFLNKINALTLGEGEALTPLGRHLARLPVDCLCGKMILFGSLFSCLDPILSIAASLGYRDPFVTPMGKERLVDERRLFLAKGSYSDHILLANVLEEYERCLDRGTHRQFVWENFLSESVLKQLLGMKQQFAELLHTFGYIASPNSKDEAANRHSGNQTLVKAIVCAGLYPNVVKAEGQYGKIMDRVRLHGPPNDPRMSLHPKSVSRMMPTFGDVWLAYFERMKLSEGEKAKAFLFDVTPVGSMALLFFGGSLRRDRDRSRPIICVDEWIKFNSDSADTTRLVQELRAKLDDVLELKVERPKPIDWDANDVASHIMCAIVELLSRED